MPETFSPYLRLIQRTGSTKHPGGFALTDLMLRRAKLKKKSRVLDVGCGAGHTAAHIASTYGCKVHAVDISSEAIERARAVYQKESYFDRIKFEVADVNSLSQVVSGYFDVVLCESVLIFVQDKQRALDEMGSLVKPGGYLALNELCASVNDECHQVRDFFAEPEMGGFLCSAKTFTDWFSSSTFNLVMVDEQPFDIKAQAKAEWAQWGNFKGAVQLLETSYQLLFNKHLQNDFMAVVKLTLKTPMSLFRHLNILLLLAKKVAE